MFHKAVFWSCQQKIYLWCCWCIVGKRRLPMSLVSTCLCIPCYSAYCLIQCVLKLSSLYSSVNTCMSKSASLPSLMLRLAHARLSWKSTGISPEHEVNPVTPSTTSGILAQWDSEKFLNLWKTHRDSKTAKHL